MAAVQLEAIFARLLVPDNAVIKQATIDLQMVYRDPAVISPLAEVMAKSQNPQIRQYAAVVLRKKLVRVWRRLSTEEKQSMKDILLQCLTQERMSVVLRSVAHLVSVIAKHELSLNQWVELFQFILLRCDSKESGQREVGMVVLNSLMETAALELQPQFSVLLEIFSRSLEDQGSEMVPFYALKSLTAMVEYVGSEELPLFQLLIPKIMLVVKCLIQKDEDKACVAMELFDELVECDVGIVVPHLTTLIQFCLDIATTAALGNNIRIKALSFVSWLITLKKKTLLRHGLLPTIINTMLAIMASPDEDEEEEEGGSDELAAESQSPITLAGQVLDVLSLNLPPEKIYVPIMKNVEPLLQSASKFERSAGLVAIAVISEGCSEYIKNNHLTSLLQAVYNGVKDSERLVRNSALFAIGQFSEHLQPDVSRFHGELFPLLLQFLDNAIASFTTQSSQKSGITKIFYALETFCEHLGPGLAPYLPSLMEKLFTAITTTNSIRLQELVCSAFGATASACHTLLSPYFERLVQVIFQFVKMPFSQDHLMLQSQAVDTLGILARTIRVENFRPLAQECIATGMSLMYTTDPDLRRSVYGMLASVSGILKGDMGEHLEVIVRRMMETLTSEEGVKVHYSSFQVSFLDFEEEEEEEDRGIQDQSTASIEDDDGIEGFTVENAYLEEKEDVCNSLAEIAENVGVQFFPYLDDCYREVNILSEHSSDGIRKAAVWTLGKFVKVWFEFCAPTDKEEVGILVNSTLANFAAMVKTDCEKTVVVTTLEALDDVLKSLRKLSFPMKEETLDGLMVAVQDVLENKTECQGDDEDAHFPGEEGVAEYDSFLQESAGTILGPIAGLVGGDRFIPKVQPILPKLFKNLNVNSTISEKSFAIGTLAEILEGLGQHARLLVSLYPTFMTFSKADQDDDVCSNSIYALGVLAANGLPEMLGQYPAILQHLVAVSQSPKGNNARVMDNTCAAICRMILARPDAIPLDQVVPLVLQNLPLKEDVEEFQVVYNCITFLFANHQPLFLSQLHQVLRILAQDLSLGTKLPVELHPQVAKLLHELSTQHAATMQTASNGLSAEQLDVLQKMIQHVTGNP